MPTPVTIENALRTPRRFAPGIDRLGGGALARQSDDSLLLRVGRDAVVGRLDQPTGRAIALRVPLREDGDPQGIAVHAAFAHDPVIARLRATQPSPIAGGVSVLVDGLRFQSLNGQTRTFPLIAMEWIPGPTLADAIIQAIETHDLIRLSLLGTQWFRLMQTLADARFTHGNLTPDNVMIRRGDALVLVDYDSAAWPGSPAPRSGNDDPAYRHPSGQIPEDQDRRDDFAALVIAVTLRVLASEPRLLQTQRHTPGLGLLFDRSDLADPAESAKFQRLERISDPETAALVGILATACRQPVTETPPFALAIRIARAAAGRERRAAAPEPVSPAPMYDGLPSTGSAPAEPTRITPRSRQARLTRLNALLLRQLDRAAVDYWETSGLATDETAQRVAGAMVAQARDRLAGLPELVPEPEAEQPEPAPTPEPERRAGWRVISTGAAMARLETAIAAHDHAAVLQEWQDVAGIPEASRYVAVVHQFATDYWAMAIREAARRGDAEAVLQSVGQAEQAGVAIPAALRPVIREAVRRRDATAEHQTTAPWSWQASAPELAHALDTDDDRTIGAVVAGYNRSEIGSLPAAERARIELAAHRLNWAHDVRHALRRHNDTHLAELLRQPAPGGDRLLSRVERDRVERFLSRREAQIAVTEAVQHQDDRELVQAMQKLEQSGASLPEDLDPVRFATALDRISLLAALQRVSREPEPDSAGLARLTRAALAATGNRAAVQRIVDIDQVERSGAEAAHLSRLRDAIATNDIRLIAMAATPDLLGIYRLLDPREQAAVRHAIAMIRPRQKPLTSQRTEPDRSESAPIDD